MVFACDVHYLKAVMTPSAMKQDLLPLLVVFAVACSDVSSFMSKWFLQFE